MEKYPSIFFSFGSHLYSILSCLLTLAPSVNLSVDTVPVSGDGFAIDILSFCDNSHLIPFIKRISFLPSFLIGYQNADGDEIEKHYVINSKESGIEYS